MKSCVDEEFRFVYETRRSTAVALCFSETERSGPKSSIGKFGMGLNFTPGETAIFTLKINHRLNDTLACIFPVI